jgi:hypothetical protein
MMIKFNLADLLIVRRIVIKLNGVCFEIRIELCTEFALEKTSILRQCLSCKAMQIVRILTKSDRINRLRLSFVLNVVR